ncbi:MAG: DUF1501 domain-containing protein, partial [Rubripirellula sp.]
MSSFSLGSLAISAFSPKNALFAAPAIDRPHVSPRIRSVIFLFMHGGPSHVDTFDYKPMLAKQDGKPLPFALPPHIDAVPRLLNGPWKFKQRG